MKRLSLLCTAMPLIVAFGRPPLGDETGVPKTSVLTAAKYSVRLQESVNLQYATAAAGVAGTGQVAAWPGDVGWLFTRAAQTQENRHDVRPAQTADNFVGVAINEPGVTAIGADRKPANIEVTGAELRDFVTKNVAQAAIMAAGEMPVGDAKSRIRVISSSKLLIRANDEVGATVSSAVAGAKTGQAVEIQPLTDPTLAQVGNDLPLRTFIGGDTKSRARVQATSPTGKVTALETDSVGACHLRISEAGVWRIEFHHVARLDEDPTADWVLYSATLTFEVPVKGGAQ